MMDRIKPIIKCLLLTIVWMGFQENILAQINITGQVTDASDQTPIPGVTILIKGTSSGTVTDVDGAYSIEVPSSTSVLVFSFTGYTPQEIEVGNQRIVNVAMSFGASQLEEIVVTGFGTRKKKDLTSSISTVNSDAIEKLVSVSPQFALQGNTTGVRVVTSSGDPNVAPQIYVRGIGTWQGNAQPLYVIDGQIITPPTAGNLDVIGVSREGRSSPPNLWNLINPNDIESISVLKDASAAAIYGSRGANGVILITTKRGRYGAPTVEFNTQRGLQNIPTYDLLNTEQFVQISQEMYANNRNPDIKIENNLYGRNETNDVVRRIQFSPQFDPQSPFYINSRTTYDWQDELVRKDALSESYDLKVSGANDLTDYYLSAGFYNQEGMIYGNQLKRYTAAVNLNSRVTKWLKTGVNYKFSYQNSQLDDRGTLQDIADAPPWQPLRDPNGPSGYAAAIDPGTGDWQAAKVYGQGTNENYLAMADLNRRDFIIQRHIGQAYAEISPLDGLTLRGSLNLDYAEQDRVGVSVYSTSTFSPVGQDPATQAPEAPNSLGSYQSRQNNILNYQADFTATYSRSFGKHNIDLTGVIQDQYQTRVFKDLSGSNLLNVSDLNKITYGNDLANNTSIYGLDERFWFGYVARANYNYDSRYYLDASYRRDASSGFAEDYRWGNFYSVSGAWRISSEPFMTGLAFIDDLKLRGGWGEAGNDEAVVGAFAYLSGVAGAGSYRWGSGAGDPLGIWNPAVQIWDFPNPALSWEVTATTYIGFDALLFNNRVNITAEWYNRTTDGIQQYVNLPLSVGTQSPALNIGTLQNRGLDLLIGYNNRLGDFTYGISGNINFLQNEITDIYENQPFYVTDQFGNTRRVEEGRSIGHIWGYKLGGIFQSQQEIDNYFDKVTDQTIGNTSFVAPGDMWFQNVGGNPTEDEPFYSTTPDDLVNAFDQTEIGNTIPGYTYGVNLNAGWKNFDLSMSFYGEGDVDRYNGARARFESMSGAGGNFWVTTLNRWTPQNTNTDMPRAVVGDPAGNNRFSDRFVESAAFFRLNNWQLGYSLPGTLMDRLTFMQSLRIFVGGQNNLYLFNWSGIDPVNDVFPLPRMWNAGLRAKF